jgi:hypothetical protein
MQNKNSEKRRVIKDSYAAEQQNGWVLWLLRKFTAKVFNSLRPTGRPPKGSDISHGDLKEFRVMEQNNMTEGD